MQNIHNDIKQKLCYFIENKSIPNIIFYGPYGSGKRHIISYFLNAIYKNIENKNEYIMYINCAFGKGIKFIREELKYFAKLNMCSHKQNIPYFKSIILLHADNLTIDAQSALRRCIELFSFNTRFFILVNSKSKLIDPIVSRFCMLYIPLPYIHDKPTNLHSYNILNYQSTHNTLHRKIGSRMKKMNKYANMIDMAYDLHNIGCSTISFIDYLDRTLPNGKEKAQYIFECEQLRQNIRFEVMSLYLCLEKYKMRFFTSNEI